MGFYGCSRVSMCVYRFLGAIGIYKSLWKFMVIYECLWVPMSSYMFFSVFGCVWVFMGAYGCLWKFMSMGIYGWQECLWVWVYI